MLFSDLNVTYIGEIGLNHLGNNDKAMDMIKMF